MIQHTFYPAADWRIIKSPALSGPENMAVDAAILESVEAGTCKPTLRLYRWSPPCLSLGFSQPAADVDLTRLKELEWDLVRRPTGGRAILHADELTYSICGLSSDPRLSGGVLASYKQLSQALALALLNLELPIQTQEKKHPDLDPNQPICFEFPSNFEITVQNKKIIGSAQARKGSGVLQHGSLPLKGDITRITQVLIYENEGERKKSAADMQKRAATVKSAAGREISWDRAAEAFQEAFSRQLNLNLNPEDLTDQEKDAVKRFLHDQYDHPDWTFRK
jgi:lipoate-protein ligase A